MLCTKINLKQFLKREVKPALGCTEPVAVALAVVRAREELPVEPEGAELVVSSNIFKNGATVGIPGTNGLKGNRMAAALGLVTGKSAYGLQVLKDCNSDAVAAAVAFLESGSVTISVGEGVDSFFVKATVRGREHAASCVIEKNHENICEVTLDGETVLEKTGSNGANNQINVDELILTMTFDEVLDCVHEMDQEDAVFLLEGARMNLEIAKKGFEPGVGIGVGRAIKNSFGNSEVQDLGLLIKAWCSAASDARMSGANMPVMSSAGSGNHGITAIIPVALYGRVNGMDDESIARGLLVSHLVTAYVKSRTGRLSTTCGCAFAAGAGAAGGITWLKTRNIEKVKTAMQMVVSNLIGMLCDGAKESCAFKVGTGAIEAYHAAMVASEGAKFGAQGVVGNTVEDTINNAAEVATGMKEIEKILLKVIAKE